MSDRGFSLDNYVDVAERILEFKAKYPDGTLQTLDWQTVEIGDRTFVVYRAAAFRTADDQRPGHGIAWEPFPGKTPYTKDSELMNAETAAWGRAIVALGILANRKIASRQEVKARTENGNGASESEPQLAQDIVDELVTARGATGKDEEWVRQQLVAVGLSSVPSGNVKLSTIKCLSEQQAMKLLERFEGATETVSA